MNREENKISYQSQVIKSVSSSFTVLHADRRGSHGPLSKCRAGRRLRLFMFPDIKEDQKKGMRHLWKHKELAGGQQQIATYVCKAEGQEIYHHLWGSVYNTDSWGQVGLGRQRRRVGYPQVVKNTVRHCEREVRGGRRDEGERTGNLRNGKGGGRGKSSKNHSSVM